MPGLWSYAAAWEFQRQGNVAAARRFLQRGLRNCGASEELWLDYFRMEARLAAPGRTRSGHRADTEWMQSGHSVDTEWMQSGHRVDAEWTQRGYRAIAQQTQSRYVADRRDA